MVSVNAACAIMLGGIPGATHSGLVKDIMGGAKLACFSLTEPQAGSDVQNLLTYAEQREDRWYLTGEKYLATGAAVADVILVAARSRHDQPTRKSTSLWVVPVPSRGLTITPLAKMAANGYASCHLRFDQVELGAHAVVGKVDGAWPTLSLGGTIERVLVAASCIGLSERIGEFLHHYAQERQVDGQPLYALTNIRHQIVDIAIQIRAASALTEQAITAICTGQNPLAAVCSAKVYAAQMQQAVSMTAMNVLGGRAYLTEYPVERWLREGLLALWAGGTNELQKNLMARNPFRR
jgi:alkylation response protein AidB-like acyl-CoA dehydrogenase